MGLPVLELLQPPRPQPLVDGLDLATRAEVLGAAGGRRLGGRQGGGGGRGPGVDGAVGRVLRQEERACGGRRCGRSGRGGDCGDGGGPAGQRPSPAAGGRLVEGPRWGVQSPGLPQGQRQVGGGPGL